MLGNKIKNEGKCREPLENKIMFIQQISAPIMKGMHF
jgi:hypothetical protein